METRNTGLGGRPKELGAGLSRRWRWKDDSEEPGPGLAFLASVLGGRWGEVLFSYLLLI